jgi:tetratricopeptide (TPR) repeat protein
MLNSSSNIELTEQYIQDGQALFPYVEASDKLSFVITESYIYLSLERYEDAVCIIENILRDIPLGEDNESFYATLYHNLGRGYMLQNNCNEAIKYLEIAKNLQQKVNGSVNEKTEKYLKVCYAKKQ